MLGEREYPEYQDFCDRGFQVTVCQRWMKISGNAMPYQCRKATRNRRGRFRVWFQRGGDFDSVSNSPRVQDQGVCPHIRAHLSHGASHVSSAE